MRSLGASAAARGVTNTGDTMKDFINYGQRSGSQEYQGLWDRWAQTYQMNRSNALNTYNTNYGTQYRDPYEFQYRGAMDAYQPQLLGWQTGVQVGQHESDQNRLYDWNNHVFDATMNRNNRLDNFDEWYRRLLLQYQISQ